MASNSAVSVSLIDFQTAELRGFFFGGASFSAGLATGFGSGRPSRSSSSASRMVSGSALLLCAASFKAADSFGFAGFEVTLCATAAAGASMRTGFLHAGQATRFPMSEGLRILRTASHSGQTTEIDDAIVRRLLGGNCKSFQIGYLKFFAAVALFLLNLFLLKCCHDRAFDILFVERMVRIAAKLTTGNSLAVIDLKMRQSPTVDVEGAERRVLIVDPVAEVCDLGML